ncbi:MAG: M48 family metalloprotease [Candidatus Rokubacteria bacterium]|nr:M48 family metalloprotease [Candidatus Rokubacteria bacterium]
MIASGDQCLLAGIAAHEISHDILKHAERSATTSDVTSVFTTIVGTAAGFVIPGAGYVVSAAASFGLNAYSRTQESAADAKAITLLRGAGKPDWLLRYALEILQRESKSGGGPSWMSTHPAIADRIAAQPAGDPEEVLRLCGTPDDQGKTPSSR